MRKWEAVFTDADREVLGKSGYGRKQPFGKSPALLIIDVTLEFLGTEQPVLQSIRSKKYRASCGEAGWMAVRAIQNLVQVCRTNGVPVVYVKGDNTTRHLCGFTSVKMWDTRPNPQVDKIPDVIAPQPSDLVVCKTRASAFFGTPLAIALRTMGIDSLLVTGVSTSGCVRASVVDAFSHGFTCFVVEECVFDRFELSHLVNLFDMDAKYADVITLDEATKYVMNPAK